MVVIALRRRGLLLALMALVALACSSGAGVPWIYENDSNAASLHSSSVEVKATSATSTEDAASAKMETIAKNAPSKKKGNLWTWGGAPQGFTASNGTLYYPPGYYFPWTGFPESYYGYTKSGYYPGYNEPKTYSGYSFGFSSGTHPGFAIMSLLYPNDASGYDPWNNYPGYDPRFPYILNNNTIVGRDYL
ncbi:Uncharacterised protein [uncultured archaeon]|nr:Uncharacterised protein [uncultured archaeon]